MDNPTSDWYYYSFIYLLVYLFNIIYLLRLDIVDLYQHAAQLGNVRGIMYDSIYIDSLARIFDGYVNT